MAALTHLTASDLEVATATVIGVVVHDDARSVRSCFEVAAGRVAVLRDELEVAA